MYRSILQSKHPRSLRRFDAPVAEREVVKSD
jgi:hypothetical protein